MEEDFVELVDTRILVMEYRSLKAEFEAYKNLYEPKMVHLKSRIKSAVEQDGDYKDDDGYASIITVSPSDAVDAKQVSNLIKAWVSSEDSIMKSCGEMLKNLLTVKNGYSYIKIK